MVAQVRRGSDPWIDPAVETKVISGCSLEGVVMSCQRSQSNQKYQNSLLGKKIHLWISLTFAVLQYVTLCYAQPWIRRSSFGCFWPFLASEILKTDMLPRPCTIWHGLAASGDLRHLPKPQIARVVGTEHRSGAISWHLVANLQNMSKILQSLGFHILPQFTPTTQFTHVYSCFLRNLISLRATSNPVSKVEAEAEPEPSCQSPRRYGDGVFGLFSNYNCDWHVQISSIHVKSCQISVFLLVRMLSHVGSSWSALPKVVDVACSGKWHQMAFSFGWDR